MDGTPSVSMRAILLLTILMTSGDFDKKKQEQFEKERPLFQRNHQKRFAAFLSKSPLVIRIVSKRIALILTDGVPSIFISDFHLLIACSNFLL
jgi:hypothetical protein